MLSIRQNFHEDVEAGINKQINLELSASYAYLSMGMYFKSEGVALKNIAEYFLKQSSEEREHALKLMEYQVKRGGAIKLIDIKAPANNTWGTAADSLMEALKLEKRVNKQLLDLHTLGETHGDKDFCDFLEENYLNEQVESIKEISDLMTNAQRCGEGLGEFMFDKEAFS